MKILTASVSSLLFSSLSNAAMVSYDFDGQQSGDLFSGGVSGWSQDSANPSAFGTTFPLGYIGSVNFTGATSNGGYLGTYQANTADNSSTTLSGSLAGAGQIPGRSVGFNVAILDNANDSFTTRDAFGVDVTNSSGASVARIDFSPNASNESAWDVAIGVNGGSTVTTAYSLTQGSGYELAIQFAAEETRFLHRASSGGNLIGLGTLDRVLGDFGDFQVSHSPQGFAGTSANALAFDNIATVVPEPSSSLLAVLGVSSFMLRRKRK
jgi:hypothetical protein